MKVAKTDKPVLNYNIVPMTSGLLFILDSFSFLLLLGLFFGIGLYEQNLIGQKVSLNSTGVLTLSILVTAILAPSLLYDRHFGSIVSRGRIRQLMRSHLMRFMFFASIVLVLARLGSFMDNLSVSMTLAWVFTGLALTSLTRLLMAHTMRRYQRQGALSEVVAVVGAGPVADRLVETLRGSHGDTVELLGIFDDKILNAPESTHKAVGNIAELLEIGKRRKIDWILLALPPTAERRVLEITQRLKALSVPVGLCPQHVGLDIPCREVDYVGEIVPVSLLTERVARRWESVFKTAGEYLPRWVITVMLLPLITSEAIARRYFKPANVREYDKFCLQLDNKDTSEFTDVAARFGEERFGYVVTPNVDQIIRLHEDSAFRALYADATYTLLDSRFLSHLLRLTQRERLPVCTGSDLTANILSKVVNANDGLVLIGGTDTQAEQLRELYNLRKLYHYNPPMGFIRDPQMVETCLQFIENHAPFRFCFLAVGSPQQEVLAQKLKQRGMARGLALCIGASINFLTGDEQRAPQWMQQSGTEWLFRLLQAPKRMARRYLLRGPRIFRLLFNAEIVLRETAMPNELQTRTS